MKKIGITIIKSIGFFLGWAILVSILPLSSSKEQAIWRLWAEITPLLAIAVFTLIFWLVEKKNVELHLFDNPVKGRLSTHKEHFDISEGSNSLVQQRHAVTSFTCEIPGKNQPPR